MGAFLHIVSKSPKPIVSDMCGVIVVLYVRFGGRKGVGWLEAEDRARGRRDAVAVAVEVAMMYGNSEC